MVHRIRHIYDGNSQAQLPDGRWVHAVCTPYYVGFFGRLKDAWQVLTGQAKAFTWPVVGELEHALRPK